MVMPGTVDGETDMIRSSGVAHCQIQNRLTEPNDALVTGKKGIGRGSGRSNIRALFNAVIS